jgi:photosystem II oxygen-evolving enhancer protein 3
VGDGTSYSEGAAYGTDQSTPLYSPYSVYGEEGPDSIYKPDDSSYAARKKSILAESKKRLANLDGYIAKKKWFEVRDELTRYMYETRGAVRGLASTKEQKAAAQAFFNAIEATDGAARLKKQDEAAAAAKASISALDAFVASL